MYNGYISGCWLPIFTYIYIYLPSFAYLPGTTPRYSSNGGENMGKKHLFRTKFVCHSQATFRSTSQNCAISLLAILGPWTRTYPRHPGGVLEMRSWRMSLESKEDTIWQSKVAMETPNLEIGWDWFGIMYSSLPQYLFLIPYHSWSNPS